MTEILLEATLNEKEGINAYSFYVQLLICLSIFFFCFLVAQLVSGAIIVMYYQATDMLVIAADVKNLNALRYAQIFASLISFLLPAFIFSKLKTKSYIDYVSAKTGFPIFFFLLIPLMLLCFYPCINLIYYVNEWIGISSLYKGSQEDYKMIVDALMKDTSVYAIFLNIITVGIIPAIAEEWIFRGTLQKLFMEKWNAHLAVFVAATIFSLIHFEFSGFLPRIVLGMFLGYLFYYTGSIWASIFAHAVNNTTQVILVYLNNASIYKSNVDVPEMPKVWELIVYTVAFVILCRIFYYFVQKRKKSTFAG